MRASAGIVLMLMVVSSPLHAAAKRRAAKPALAKPSVIDPALAAALKKAPSQTQFPEHDSVMLLDLGKIVIRPDGTTVSEFREAHKLFNEKARDRAEVSFDYNASYDTLEVVQARSIRKTGRVQDVLKSEIRRESGFSDFSLYDDSKSIGFSLPGIEDDSVIDYTYRKTSRPMMPGHFKEQWTFTGWEPSMHSRLELTAPTGLKVEYKLHNSDLQPVITTSADGKTRTWVWELRDIPPVESEPDMPPISEVTVWLEISNGCTWAEVARWFWGLARPQFTPNAAIQKTVHQLIAGRKTDEEKAAAIYEWVTRRVRYVGLEFGISAFKPHAAAQVHEKLYGDCKDKTGLLITMLGVAGLKAHPVLLDTGQKRKPDQQLPSLNAFDHCIAFAELGGKSIWLDPTAENSAYGEIPAGDRGAEAFVIRDGVGRFETIPRFSPAENGGNSKMLIRLQPEGGAEVDLEVLMTGVVAEGMRTALRDTPANKVNEMMQQMAQAFAQGATLRSYKLPELEKNGPTQLLLSLSAKEWGRKIGNLLLVPLNSGSTRFLGRSPYTRETRRWPIVMDEATLYRYELIVTMPESYAIEEAPIDADLSNPLMRFRREVTRSSDGRSLTLRGSFETTVGRLPASEYPRVKTLFEALTKSNQEPLVLRRK